ncbi:MAG TPA: MFS transporter [Nocardioidaceae bacterium]|nr:MFS transporter [Nocardioidaceae bacterium]
MKLQGRYGMAVAIALLALSPNTVLTTAYSTLVPVVAADLHTSQLALQVAEGMSNAGLAAAAVVAAYLSQRFVQRYLFIGYELAFVLGSVLAAAAPGIELFFAGRVLQGVATGFMIVGALPVLVTRFGVGKLPLSVVVINVAIFGATTVGPLVAGPVAALGAWRLLFWLLAAVGALGLVAALLGYARFAPPDPGLRLAKLAVTLAAVATFLPFYATSVLMGTTFASAVFWVPFVVGLIGLVALIVIQYRAPDPTVPVKALSTQLPVTGTVVAMVGGAVFVAVLGLAQLFLSDVAGLGAVRAGSLFWPMPVGLVVAALIFGAIFRTRWLPVLVNAGLLALIAGAALLLWLDAADPAPIVLGASVLLGFGAGATVSPGLFLAAMGVPSSRLGRAFALVLLLRAESAYAVAPIVLYVAQSSPSLRGGIEVGLVAMICLAGLGLAAALAIPAVSGARLREPDLVAWLEEGRAALPTPTTAVHARPGRSDETAEPLVPRPRRRTPR